MTDSQNAPVRFELTTLTDYSDESILREIRRVAAAFTGKRLTREAFNKLSRVGATTLTRRFGSWSAALDKAGISEELAPRPPKQITRDELVATIQKLAAERDQTPTLDEVAEVVRVDRSTINHKFGRWPDLLKELGLTPVPLGRRYTDEECFENVLALWTHYGRQPAFGELKLPPSRVGPKAYILRWGGWRVALGAFIEYVNLSPEPVRASAPVFEADATPTKSEEAVPTAPRTLGLALRYRVLVRDRFRCQICGRSPAKELGVELHVDHIVPWSKGGPNTEENLRTLCFDCNLGKGDKHEPAI